MFKAMILLKRRDDMVFDEFRRWWLEDHAPLARQLPKLQAATFNLVDGDGSAEFDGVAELWFDSKDAFEMAYQSELGKRVAADSIENVSKRKRLFVTEFNITES